MLRRCKQHPNTTRVASHTINHLDVTTLDSATLHHELADSKRTLESRFGVKIQNFCYPAGHYDQAIPLLQKVVAAFGSRYVTRAWYADSSQSGRLWGSIWPTKRNTGPSKHDR